ncbi:MAG TPA: cell division protein FtsZ [Candidatus Syntrophosphaera thermopropionivorans]|jgi:cell division protein FtsZ|nr:cell division protein FtsZ [Candidatus Syntrophosphaera sp.]HNU97429.1 cell division protein FtsZ [Candidatus Syntrophosphaera thermopropionivorans]HNZ44559.1 cell division protein FtsZ [Candidatus Syntrophosphaera thermopropionivorans]HON32846.1 cell division protein FtsZ [Candidatus Syntrophosphaera thermopropionivorans]HOT39664.1 cell division protein FtsZ [Candidatus Syntrophosphaera thermopropionivorans]
MIEFDEKPGQIGTNIKIIGVGGAGGNAVNTMITKELTGVEFIVANTDNSDLMKNKAKMKLQMGKKLCGGLGTGANPELGERAAEEAKDEIKSHLEGADMVIIASGMGGGTGTGASPIIAKLAKDLDILTLAIVTTPFPFEGSKRMTNAKEGINKLVEYVDTLIVIPNSRVSEIYADRPLLDAFAMADNVLYEAAKAISDIININGLVNVDFADVKTVMQNGGFALMGSGVGEGENRAILAAEAAINNPLLSDISLQGCQSLLINVSGGKDFKMSELEEVTSVIVNVTGSDANIIMGVIIDPDMEEKVTVTIIATGLQNITHQIGDFISLSQGMVKPEKHTKTANPKYPTEDEIEDIFHVLNINQTAHKEEDTENKKKEPEKLNPRTDLPSFLKALD